MSSSSSADGDAGGRWPALETPVSTVAIQEPVRIGPDETMDRALFRMRQRHIRALLVMEGERLLGIVTDRDAVLHIEPGESGAGVRVRDVMTPDPITVRMDDPLGIAAQRLLDGVHHLPIVDDAGRVVGIVAQGRILHALIETLLPARA